MRTLVVVVVLSVAACKKSSGSRFEEVMAKMTQLRDAMCLCKDKACADKVQDDLNRWSAENAKNADDRPERPDEATMKKMQEVGTRYGECMTQAMNGAPEQGSGTAAAASAADGLAVAPTTPLRDADAIIAHTYSGLGRFAVTEIQLDYVRANGELDAKYGKARFALGIALPPDPAQDPDRPLGAPIVAPAPAPYVGDQSCPHLEWTNGIRNTIIHLCKAEKAIARPRCSAVEVWRRARAADAPEGGLAKLEYIRGEPAAWLFVIEDAPRKVNFRVMIEDTCEPTIERPL